MNADAQVNILDLVLVAQNIGQSISINSRADVNGDGTINILDLVLVAQHLGESIAAASPSTLAAGNISGLDPAMVQAWIAQAQVENRRLYCLPTGYREPATSLSIADS